MSRRLARASGSSSITRIRPTGRAVSIRPSTTGEVGLGLSHPCPDSPMILTNVEGKTLVLAGTRPGGLLILSLRREPTCRVPVPEIQWAFSIAVCLNYADFLEHVIPANQPHFDDWVVVTCRSDEPTFRVCERHGVRTVFCPYFAKNGSPFNKALAINLGLAHLKCSDWMIHIDADTVLPG